MEFQRMVGGSLPIKRGRLIKTISDSTIRGITDAIVELVTNSDDSYTRAEEKGTKLSGKIDIYLSRSGGGHCREIIVVDEATGMDIESLKSSIEFSGETSGFKEGKNVRGFFGRGLKESIIALGKGGIFTLWNGVLSRAEISYNEEKKDAEYELFVPIQNLTRDQLKEYGLTGDSGTVVKIQVTNEKKDHIPSMFYIEEPVENLAPLRSINSSPNRIVTLHYIELDGRNKGAYTTTLKYKAPEGKIVFEEDRNILESTAHFKISESTEQLISPKQPFGKAGLLIKAEGAILDNQLFGFETDPNGLYFYGEIVCPGISKAIRSGDESIVDYSRGGLAWRHEYNKELERISKEIIQKCITERRERLNLEKQTKIEGPINKILEKICKKLSDLAKDEIEEKDPGPGEIQNFIIRPIFANIKPDEPRTFTAYVPEYIAEDEGTKLTSINSSNNNITILNDKITLEKYSKDNAVLKAVFKVIGKTEGETAKITATLGDLSTSCEVRVGKFTTRKGHPRPPGSGGGLFKEIKPFLDEKPIQRSEYEQGGLIKVYTKFPGISDLLGERFENITTPEGRIILAEVVIETYCRYLTNKKRDVYEIDRYMSEMDRLRRKVSADIYQILTTADITELISRSDEKEEKN